MSHQSSPGTSTQSLTQNNPREIETKKILERINTENFLDCSCSNSNNDTDKKISLFEINKHLAIGNPSRGRHGRPHLFGFHFSFVFMQFSRKIGENINFTLQPFRVGAPPSVSQILDPPLFSLYINQKKLIYLLLSA